MKLVVTFTLLGAGLAAAGSGLRQGWILYRAGADVSAVSTQALLFEVMSLHLWALAGAAVGLILGVIVLLVQWALRVQRSSALAEDVDAQAPPPELDPDDIIRQRRARKAEEYLARRKAES